MAEIRHFDASAAPEAAYEALKCDGGIILDNVIPAADALAILAELRPFVETTETGVEDFGGMATSRTGALIARSARVREALLNPRVLEMADRLLLPFCERYQLNLTQLIRIMPGETTQMLHRDRWIWGNQNLMMEGVETQLGVMWALTDFTMENGATRVVPGSGAWPDIRQPQEQEIAYAVMERGSALVYTGSVLHGGGANTSRDQERWGMLLNFCLGWLRQEENQYLSCPPEIAKEFAPQLQALIGYATGATGLGYYTPPLDHGTGSSITMPEHAVGSKGLSINSSEDFLAMAEDAPARS